jgi:phenylacetate-CoA ligase
MQSHETRIVNPKLERASRAELLALQERRLIAQIRRAYERIPLYRSLWPATAGSLTSLAQFRDLIPFQSKADLLDPQDTFMRNRVAKPGSPVYALHMTSGTTGLGQEIHPLTRLDVEAMGSTWVYQAHWAGLDLGDSIFYTFPVGMQTGGLSSFSLTEKMASRAFQVGPYPTEKKIEYLLRFKPNALVISPAFLTRFQALLEQANVDPRAALPNLKAIFIAGENYSPDWAERALAFWGAGISEWYGCMQGGLNLCFSCEGGILPGGRRGHLHAMEHRVLCEVLHPETHEPVQPGEEGEVVITPLFREAFPVVRFRTGDKVRLMPEPCACGRPFMSIEAGTVARYDDMMKIRGQNLWPDAVDRIVFNDGDIEEYAGSVYTDSEGREIVAIDLEFRPAEPFSAEHKTRRLADLSREIQTKLNVRMELREVPYKTLPRFEFKVRRWTDERRSGRKVVRYVRD